MKYVRGTGSPCAWANAVAMALSRTRLIDRELLMVGIPAASAASRMLSPGPPDTVFKTKASYRWLGRSDKQVTDSGGSKRSIVWPHRSSWSAMTSGIESPRYCSSTMKHKRIFRLASPGSPTTFSSGSLSKVRGTRHMRVTVA